LLELNITDNNIKTVSESVNVDFCGPSFDYLSTEGTKLETMSIFRYGYLTSLKIYSQARAIADVEWQ
jgi:hypothetical protein